MWSTVPAIQREIVLRAHPRAYCAVSFGGTSAEDRFRIFDPQTRQYLSDTRSTPGEAWAATAYSEPPKTVS